MKLKSLLVISSPICLSYVVPQMFEFYDMFKKRYKLIHIVSRMGYASIVRKLIENGYDIEAKLRNGATPLHVAALHGKLSVVKVLVKMGAEINSVCSSWKRTPLFDAIRSKNEEIVRLLLENKADIHHEDDDKVNPIFFAVYLDSENIVKLLLENGADQNAINRRGNTLLLQAVLCKQEGMVKLLIEYKANLNAEDDGKETALFKAVILGLERMVKLLLEHSADHRANIHHKAIDGNTPIILAIMLYHTKNPRKIQIIKALIRNGADINTVPALHFKPLIHTAVQNCDTELLQFLIGNGADTNLLDFQHHRTPLFLAIKNKHEEGIKLLMDNGSNINSKDVDGNTPLIIAVMNHPGLIEFLINSGADVNLRNNALETPLHLTASRGNIEAVKLLIENGGDVDAQTLSTRIYFSCF